jgi:hypothetical protein
MAHSKEEITCFEQGEIHRAIVHHEMREIEKEEEKAPSRFEFDPVASHITCQTPTL